MRPANYQVFVQETRAILMPNNIVLSPNGKLCPHSPFWGFALSIRTWSSESATPNRPEWRWSQKRTVLSSQDCYHLQDAQGEAQRLPICLPWNPFGKQNTRTNVQLTLEIDVSVTLQRSFLCIELHQHLAVVVLVLEQNLEESCAFRIGCFTLISYKTFTAQFNDHSGTRDKPRCQTGSNPEDWTWTGLSSELSSQREATQCESRCQSWWSDFAVSETFPRRTLPHLALLCCCASTLDPTSYKLQVQNINKTLMTASLSIEQDTATSDFYSFQSNH